MIIKKARKLFCCEILNICESRNNYKTRFWNNEYTVKYIFEINQKIIEAGYFTHYKDDEVVKHVIELSTSYGCPLKCKFCASSTIDVCQILNAKELFDIFNYIYSNNNLHNSNYVLVAIAGIGELYFTYKYVFDFFEKINIIYNNLYFSVSSCCMNQDIFNKITSVYNEFRFRNIQITHLSTNEKDIKFLVPNIPEIIPIEKNIEMISRSNINIYRINYVLISGINDSISNFNDFIKKYNSIKDKIVVRISKLNPTEASKLNNLHESDIKRAEDFLTILESNNFNAYLFYSYKDDKMNCGQLIREHIY